MSIFHFDFTANIGVLDSIVKPLPTPTPEQVRLLKSLCSKLKFRYDKVQFCDPAFQAFYGKFEAEVYGEEMKDFYDMTVPDIENQDEKMVPFIDRINEEFKMVIIYIFSGLMPLALLLTFYNYIG